MTLVYCQDGKRNLELDTFSKNQNINKFEKPS